MSKYDEITLMEEVESKRIKKRLRPWQIISVFNTLFILICVIVILTNLNKNVERFEIGTFFGIGFAIIEIILFFILNKLGKLYKIAKHNDMIRHDEMIRARERARLEEINYQTTTTKNNKEINNTINQLDLNNKKPKIPNK